MTNDTTARPYNTIYTKNPAAVRFIIAEARNLGRTGYFVVADVFGFAVGLRSDGSAWVMNPTGGDAFVTSDAEALDRHIHRTFVRALQ